MVKFRLKIYCEVLKTWSIASLIWMCDAELTDGRNQVDMKIDTRQAGFLVGGFGRQPLYDEMGAAVRNIHCYTVIGIW